MYEVESKCVAIKGFRRGVTLDSSQSDQAGQRPLGRRGGRCVSGQTARPVGCGIGGDSDEKQNERGSIELAI